MSSVRARIPGVLILAGTAALTAASCASPPVQRAQTLPVIKPGSAVASGPADMLPAGARVVTVSENLGGNAHGKQPPAPVTISDAKKVAAIVALINAQPLFPPGTYHCPLDDGQSVTMQFRATAGGPVIALASLATSGCTSIDITVGGKDLPSRGPGVGRTVAAEALKIAGLNWKLPTFG